MSLVSRVFNLVKSGSLQPSPERQRGDSDGMPEGDRRLPMQEHLDRFPNGYQEWTECEYSKLLDLVREGHTWDKISAEMGRSPKAVESAAGKAAFLLVHDGAEVSDHSPAANEGSPWPDQDLDELTALISQGRSWPEIGLELGRKPTSCKRRAEQMAIEVVRGASSG